MSRYTNYEMKNNVFGTLSAPISSLATTIQLSDGQGARFTADMLGTLETIEAGKVTKREIVKITNVSGDTLTVIRKYAPCPSNDDANTQGQVSYSFSADDTISVFITKEHFDILKATINDIYENGLDKLRVDVVSGLQIKVGAGPVLVGSSYYDFAGDTITLTNNATNYVEIDEDGLLVANTSGWTDENTKVAMVVTGSGSVSSIIDRRLATVGGKLSVVNIHELTEKNYITNEDELILSDSENIYNNKKIKAKNFGGVGNFGAGEQISAGDFIYQYIGTKLSQVNDFTIIGYNTETQKIAIQKIGTGQDFGAINLSLAKYGTPTNDLSIRIETDNEGDPSGTLINNNAYGTISQSNLTTTLTDTIINLAGTINIPKGTKCHIVLSQNTVDGNNFYKIGGKQTSPKVFKIRQYDGNTWNSYTDYGSYFTLKTATQLAGQFTLMYNSKPYFGISGNGLYLFETALALGAMYSHTLSTARDVSTAGSSTGYVNQPQGQILVNNDGTRVITIRWGSNARMLQQWNMSTAGNASTASGGDVQNLRTLLSMTTSSSDTIDGIAINPAGTKLYIMYKSIIREYAMGSAWDITTLTATGKTLTVDTPGNFCFSPDGLNIYIVTPLGAEASTIWRRKMSTAWDITTAVRTLDQKGIYTGGQVQIHPTESKLYVSQISSNTAKVYQYSSPNIVGNEIAPYIDTDGLQNIAVLKASASNSDTLPTIPMASKGDFEIGDTVIYDILFNNKLSGLTVGTKYYLSDTAGEISTTAGTNEFEVGIAIEPTILKLKQTY